MRPRVLFADAYPAHVAGAQLTLGELATGLRDRFDVCVATVAEGASITFDQVLAVSGNGAIKIGKPLVAGASVQAEVLVALEKGEKVYIQKFRRRKNYRKRTGHRQKYTQVKIGKILA